MQVAIIGDSFTHTYKDTWIETVCNECNLEVIHQIGFSGQSQFRIYLEFLEIIKKNPDIIISCYTQPSRLYHPLLQTYPNAVFEQKWNVFLKEVSNKKEILTALEGYYLHLYQENFAQQVFKFIVNDMQKMCKERKIKLINIPCFPHDFVEYNYGLWINSAGGLVECAGRQMKNHENKAHLEKNHFLPHGHEILANALIPHIKTYITTDQEFHISLLYPEIFA